MIFVFTYSFFVCRHQYIAHVCRKHDQFVFKKVFMCKFVSKSAVISSVFVYFYISASLCVCVCVCVRMCMQLARPLSAQIGFCGRDKSDLLPTLTKSQPLVARGHPRYLGNLGNPGKFVQLGYSWQVGQFGQSWLFGQFKPPVATGHPHYLGD